MQTCYNCGKQVEDHVLICPECGALVKRYGRPEPQQTQEYDLPPTETGDEPQPHGAVWRTQSGKYRLRGGITFWLVLCAIFTGYSLLGFACTYLIYRFQSFYFETIALYPELAELGELLELLLASIDSYPVYYAAVALLVCVQFVGVVWFLCSKRRAAFYVFAASALVLTVLQLIMGGGVQALLYVFGPLMAWLMLRKSWSQLR